MARKKDPSEEVEQTEDLGNIMDRSWNDMPEVLLLPVGTYKLVTRNIAYMAPKEAGQNGKVVVFFIPKEPLSDVDTSDLPENYDITENEVTATFWIERNKDWQPVRDLLKALGVDTEGGDSMKDTFKAARKKEITAYVDVRSFQSRGQTVTQNVATDFQADA
jgi:hypothetical protein